MDDGLNKNDWLNTLYMSQESMRFKDCTKVEINSSEQSEEGIGTTILVSAAVVTLIFELINGIYNAADKHKKKQIEKSDEFKKLEKDVNTFVKIILDVSEYLRKNINKEMYKIDDTNKIVDFSKGIPKYNTKLIVNNIIESIQYDKKNGKKIDELSCRCILFDLDGFEYDWKKYDIFEGRRYDDLHDTVIKILNDFLKQNKDKKFICDDTGSYEDGIDAYFSYKL